MKMIKKLLYSCMQENLHDAIYTMSKITYIILKNKYKCVQN